MPNRKNKKVNKTKNRSNANDFHSAPNPVAYVQPRSRIEKFRASIVDSIPTTGGGNILYSFPITPTATTEWSELSTLYEEFRIIGGLWTIVPFQALETSGSSRFQSLALVAYDQAESYTPAGLTDLLSYATRDIINTQSVVHKPYTYGFTVPMAGKDNPIIWFPTDVTFVPTSCLLMVAEGLTASATYFQSVVDLYIEFRTRS